MATVLTPTTLVKDTASASAVIAGGTAPGGIAFTAGEYTIALPKEGKLLIIINSTYGSTTTATFAAGGYLAAGQGSMAVTLAQNEVKFIEVSSDRFKAQGVGTNATGTETAGLLSITFAASNTGFIQTWYLP